MMYSSHTNECISNDVYMKCVLTNDFMGSASPDPVHRQVGLGA